MLHKDVLMRQVQQAVQVMLHALAQVLRLRSEDRYEEAVQRINDAFGELELSPRPVGELSTKELIQLCETDRGFSVDLALGIADLLREEAEILSEMGRAKPAGRSAARARALYERALNTEGAALPLDIGRRLGVVERLSSGTSLQDID